MKENLLVSFSGGETSAYLAKWLLDNKSEVYNLIFVFANTGDEEEETLLFIDKCSKEWSINIVWVEAVVHHNERIGSTHKIVNFKTASRNREPYKEVIKKYGIPNQNFLHCNREMKLNPIKSYIKSLGWKKYKSGKFKSSKKNFLEASVRLNEIICEVNEPNKTNKAKIAKSLGDNNLVKIGSENIAMNNEDIFEIK